MQVSHISTQSSVLSGSQLVPSYNDLVKARSPFSVWIDLGEGQEIQCKVDNGYIHNSEPAIRNVLRRTFGFVQFAV